MTRVSARLAAGALVVLAVWEVMVLVSAERSAPAAADWQAVAAAIPATLGRDQLVVFAPRWIDPIGRQWIGARLSIDQVARMDTVRYREIWEVSIRGASAPELATESPVSVETYGPIRLRRFERAAPEVTWALSDGARVCEIDFEPRRGAALELHSLYAQARREFAHVPLGSELQVYAGLDDYQKRSRNRSTAIVRILVDGREVAHRTIGNDDGWAPLPAVATPEGAHDVEIVTRVARADGPVDLSVCVAAEARARRR
jgi:hypothetical protein